MEQYIRKSTVAAEIENRIKKLKNLHKENEEELDSIQKTAILLCIHECKVILSFLDTLEVKESDETAKAFARIIRANLTGIDKDVQYKFEQLYKEITGEKMYQGYND